MHGHLSKVTQPGCSQKTLKRPVFLEGIGVHTGEFCQVTVEPAPPDTGIRFQSGVVLIDAAVGNICGTQGATTLSNQGSSIQTVEHLLAALIGLNYDNALIRVKGPEIPILDGSALPWVRLLQTAGVRNYECPRNYWALNKSVNFQDGDSLAFLEPAKKTTWRVSLMSEMAYWAGGIQNFITEIAPARTFVQMAALNPMREKGLLKGAHEGCGVLLEGENPVNTSWRLPAERARHKLLDAIGDFALLGAPLLADIHIVNGSHSFHRKLLETLLADSATSPF